MNYIKYNALINMLSRPPKIKQKENFLKKEGYGQVPSYLKEIKSQIQGEYDFIASLKNSGNVCQSGCEGLEMLRGKG